MSRARLASLAAIVVAACTAAACAALRHEPSPPSTFRGEPLPPEPPSSTHGEDEQLRVREVAVPIVVAAWAEPRDLPPGGGSAQILVRVQRRGGARFPGVEVRLHASQGTLFSAGRTLVTDAQGMTRDRLTTQKTALITMNAGGTRYRFQVIVADASPEE